MNKKKIMMIIIPILLLISVFIGANTLFKEDKIVNTENNTNISTNNEIKKEEEKEDIDKKENKNKEEITTKEEDKQEEIEKEEVVDVVNKQEKNEEAKKEDDKSEKEEAQIEKPKPKPEVETEKPKPEKPKPEIQKETVKISINCNTAINSGLHNESGFTHLPSSGIILSTITVEIEKGYTVLDVLKKVTRQNNIHMEYTGSGSSAYIEGIHNLYEFDGGEQSGWMYSVNGWYPNYGAGAYEVKNNDVIKWNYTLNLGNDLGAK